MKMISISNERICRFYKENPSINFEAVNLIFLDLFDKLLHDMNTTMNTTIQSQILSSVNENTQKINEMTSNIVSLKDSVTIMHKEITNNVLLKFNEIKENYINHLRTILKENTSEDICSLMEKMNQQIIDKTTIVMNEIIPKSQTQCYSQIQESIRSFHKSISDDTRVLLKYIDNNSVKDYINHFEMKSSIMLQNLQQPIYTFITASEERINQNLLNMKDQTCQNTNLQEKMFGEITKLIYNIRDIPLSEMKNESNNMNILLNKLYNTGEINPISNKNKTTINETLSPTLSKSEFRGSASSSTPPLLQNTFMVKKNNKSKILIHSIDNESNINQEEIQDFIYLIEEHKSHGIFLSQKSGFTNKPNFHIEIYNKFIMVFVHNVNYSVEKIKSAVDIIDNLSIKLRELNNDNEYEYNIDKEVLEEINKEYQNFIINKETIINVLKESQKKVFSQIDEFKFPTLDKFLSTKYGTPIHKQGLKCDLCKNFNANNLKALAAHKRGCFRKFNIISREPVK